MSPKIKPRTGEQLESGHVTLCDVLLYPHNGSKTEGNTTLVKRHSESFGPHPLTCTCQGLR